MLVALGDVYAQIPGGGRPIDPRKAG